MTRLPRVCYALRVMDKPQRKTATEIGNSLTRLESELREALEALVRLESELRETLDARTPPDQNELSQLLQLITAADAETQREISNPSDDYTMGAAWDVVRDYARARETLETLETPRFDATTLHWVGRDIVQDLERAGWECVTIPDPEYRRIHIEAKSTESSPDRRRMHIYVQTTAI